MRDAFASTYARRGAPDAALATFAPALDPRQIASLVPGLADRCSRYLAQRFDLLGSGWRTVGHGTGGAGFEGHRYPASPTRPDPAGAWLSGEVSRCNLAPARAVWRLLGAGYRPVDWQLDFRSGYRWPPRRWYRAVRYGHRPGVDVKVPWELARMQHLPQLALAFGCARAGLPRFLPAGRYREGFRNQVLDFVATNPPRYGVNWHSSMEVAIRLANWLVAYDLFRAYGAAWDPDFERIFARSGLEHGRHLAANLDASPAWCNNHYLANLTGLAFAHAYLPPTRETRRWAQTAAKLVGEIERQFLPDGGHFEASTGYHAFAAELAAYGLAMLSAGRHRTRGADELPAALGGALDRIAEFLVQLTKPGGRLVRIGDHDGGRLFQLQPRAPETARLLAPDRESPDAAHAVAAVNGLLGRADLTRWCGGRRLEQSLVASLAGETPWREAARPPQGRRARGDTNGASGPGVGALCERLRAAPAVEESRLTLAAPGPSLLAGMEVRSFPCFGAYVFCSERLFVCLRAGFGRDDGTGGHAHVDQLGLEVAIDGAPWIRDPGSFVYTADADLRNAYRSSTAHFVPYALEGETALWRRGVFHLDLDVAVRAVAAEPAGAAVDLLLEGVRIAYLMTLGEQEIVTETRILSRPDGGRLRVRCHPGRAGRIVFQGVPLTQGVAFAPEYGLREQGSGTGR